MLTLKQPRGLTMATIDGGLVIAGADKVYDIGTAIAYCIDGKAYLMTATVSSGTTPTTDGNTSAAFNTLLRDKGCVFVWCLNSSGTVSVRQGPIHDIDPTADTFEEPPQFPYIPDSVCPFAYSIHQTAGTSAAAGWTFGTDNWNATGVTDITVDVMTLPTRPPQDTTA